MPLKIVRNDITKMNTEIIVNTANDHPTVGTGCDFAIYQAAGREQLLAYRRKLGYKLHESGRKCQGSEQNLFHMGDLG